MRHSGPNLNKWAKKISPEMKVNFAIEMVRHVLPSLKKIHDLGYSHGDIKPGNICARKSHDGSFQFTLIDLGMSARLAQLGCTYNFKKFRGNIMFASTDNILRARASQLDDIYSLLCVAHHFIFGTLPWIEHIEDLQTKNTDCNFYRLDRYLDIRTNMKTEFDQ